MDWEILCLKIVQDIHIVFESSMDLEQFSHFSGVSAESCTCETTSGETPSPVASSTNRWTRERRLESHPSSVPDTRCPVAELWLRQRGGKFLSRSSMSFFFAVWHLRERGVMVLRAPWDSADTSHFLPLFGCRTPTDHHLCLFWGDEMESR